LAEKPVKGLFGSFCFCLCDLHGKRTADSGQKESACDGFVDWKKE
jgi:hypothetical protein